MSDTPTGRYGQTIADLDALIERIQRSTEMLWPLGGDDRRRGGMLQDAQALVRGVRNELLAVQHDIDRSTSEFQTGRSRA